MGFPINPPTTALVDDTRRPTPEFYRFLLQIQRMVGGPSDPFADTWLLGATPRPGDALGDASGVVFLQPPVAPVAFPDELVPPSHAAALAAADLAAHVAAADPHTGYVREAQSAAWAAATGTEARTALASYAGQTISNPPTQAEVQALDNAVKAISQALVGLINDLRFNRTITP